MTFREIYIDYFGRRASGDFWPFMVLSCFVGPMPFEFFWDRTWLNPNHLTKEELGAKQKAIIARLNELFGVQ